MKFYKKALIKGNWKIIELSDEEVAKIEENLRKDNLELLRRCFQDAQELTASFPNNHKKMIQTRIAIALFDKLADAKFTRIQSALDAKIKKLEEQTTYVELKKKEVVSRDRSRARSQQED